MLDYIPRNIGVELPDRNQVGTIGDILGIVINVLMGLAFVTGFIALTVGFLQLVISGGDPKARAKGIDTLKWGGVAILLSFFILVIKAIIVNMLGLTGYEQATPNF